jgi:hypothetical protein
MSENEIVKITNLPVVDEKISCKLRPTLKFAWNCG